MHLAHTHPIVGIAIVVAAIPLEHPRVGASVDLVGVEPDGRQPARDECLPQAFRSQRQICRDAEAAKALAEHAPLLDAELATDRLGVTNDRVRAEVAEVGHLLGRRQADQGPHGSRASGAALVEHQHAVVPERPLEPGRVERAPGRPRSLHAGASLEEHEQRPVVIHRLADHSAEDPQLQAVRTIVVERDRELVLGEHESGSAIDPRRSHQCSRTRGSRIA